MISRNITPQTYSITTTEKVTVIITRERLIHNFMSNAADVIIDSGPDTIKDLIDEVITALNPPSYKNNETDCTTEEKNKIWKLFKDGVTFLLLDDMEMFEKDVFREIIIDMGPGKKLVRVYHEHINF